MKWIIDNDIPVPEAGRGPGAVRGSKFGPRLPLRELKPGQSIFVPDQIISAARLNSRLMAWTKKYGTRFRSRKGTENGESGTRFWCAE